MEDTIYEIDFQDDEAQVSEELESSSALLVKAENVVTNLESLIARLQVSKEIDRATASTIRTLTTGMESMDAHFNKYPVNSYTALASPTNLKPTLEGLVNNLAKSAVAAVKAVFKFIYSLFKTLFGSKKNKDKDLEKVKKMLEADVAVVERSKPVALTDPDKQQGYNETMLNKANMLPALASWFVSRSQRVGPAPEIIEAAGNVGAFVATIVKCEGAFLKQASDHLSYMITETDRILKLTTSTTDYTEILQTALNKETRIQVIGWIETCAPKDVNFVTFGTHAADVFKAAAAAAYNLEPFRYEEATFNANLFINAVANAVTSAQLTRTTFAPVHEYIGVESKIKQLEDNLNKLGLVHGGALGQILTRAIVDARGIAHAIESLERLVNSVRITTGHLASVLRDHRKFVQ